MKRTAVYIILGLVAALINVMFEAAPLVRYPMKLQLCTFNLEAIQFENQEINDLLFENIDAVEFELLKAEFCNDQSLTKIPTYEFIN